MITPAAAREIQETLGKNTEESDREIRKSATAGELKTSFYTEIHSKGEAEVLCKFLETLGYKAKHRDGKHGLILDIDWSEDK